MPFAIAYRPVGDNRSVDNSGAERDFTNFSGGFIVVLRTRSRSPISKRARKVDRGISARARNKTFGPGKRTQGVIDHIRKELGEIEDNPNDILEWISVATGRDPNSASSESGLKLQQGSQN